MRYPQVFYALTGLSTGPLGFEVSRFNFYFKDTCPHRHLLVFIGI